MELNELGENEWTEVPRPVAGHPCLAQVTVGDYQTTAVLDTGASTNGISEETVVDMMNFMFRQGKRPGGEGWPFQLERWQDPRPVRGLAQNVILKVLGAVVLSVEFMGPAGLVAVQMFKFKIFRTGHCTWKGLVIGAPSLRSLGLGLHTNGGGLYLEHLKMTLDRCEEQETRQKLDTLFVLQETEGTSNHDFEEEFIEAGAVAFSGGVKDSLKATAQVVKDGRAGNAGCFQADLGGGDSDLEEADDEDDLARWWNGSVNLAAGALGTFEGLATDEGGREDRLIFKTGPGPTAAQSRLACCAGSLAAGLVV